MQALTIIEDALSAIRVKREGHALPAEDAQLGLRILNRMLTHWSREELMIPYRTREELALTAGQKIYSIGSGGDLDTTRPNRIHLLKLMSGTTEYEVHPRSIEVIGRWTDKSVSGRPDYYHYEPVDPLGRIYFELTVDQAYTLILWSTKPITGFTALTTEDSVPDEYEKLLVNNLAVEAANAFGKEAGQTTKELAMATYNQIKANNQAARVPTMIVDRALLNHTRYQFEGEDF